MKDFYIKFPNAKKFASQHIDEIANQIFANSDKKLYFDLSSFEWIAAEGLIFLSSIFAHLNYNNKHFFVNFPHTQLPEDFVNKYSKKRAQSLIYIWDIWKIHLAFKSKEILFSDSRNDICNINDSFIKGLKLQLSSNYQHSSNIYDGWTTVTNAPFFASQNSSSFHSFLDEEAFESEIDECISSEDSDKIILNDILSKNPIFDKTLSTIILRELYENTVKHGYKPKQDVEIFFGLGVNKAKENTQYLKKNFDEEAIPETEGFFKGYKGFKNRPFLEFSFLDFGEGIYNTLSREYEKFIQDSENLIELSPNHLSFHKDAKVLEYAFHFNSSRQPIEERYQGNLIPRGLYDLLSIIWRYEGVLIVRSGYGKILYDFSDTKITHPKDAVKIFSSDSLFFKGTMMTIYLPEKKDTFKTTVIKKSIVNKAISTNLLPPNIAIDVLELIGKESNNSYNDLLKALDEQLAKRHNNANDTILPIDFAGCEFSKGDVKKILLYLITSQRIKSDTTIIALNIEGESVIRQLQEEWIQLKSIRKTYIFHPILCLFEDKQQEITIWLGIDDRSKEKQLNDNLLEQITSSASNGQTQNTTSINTWIVENYLPQIIESSIIRETNTVYLTSGKYYQTEFLSLLEKFQDDRQVKRISKHLVNKLSLPEYSSVRYSITNHKEGDGSIAVIDITISSQLLAKEVKRDLEKEFPNQNFELIRLSNYYSFNTESPFSNIKPTQPIILVCDVIATGHLLEKVYDKLLSKQEGEKNKKSKLIGVLCVSDTRVKNTTNNLPKYVPSTYVKDDEKIVISLNKKKIFKYEFKDFFGSGDNREIARINPITNGLNSTRKEDNKLNCLFTPDDFLKMLPNSKTNFLKIGFFEHNQSYHTYYFETIKFYKSSEGVRFVEKCLEKIAEKIDEPMDIDGVIYPIFSGAEFSFTNEYKDIFRKHSKQESKIDFIVAPRVNTPKGWRFTSIPEKIVKSSYKTLLIIDDGSCTGESIVQLLDEVSVFSIESIIVLSMIARLEDFQREFFSKIKSLKCQNKYSKKEDSTPLNVFFGVHFHIPVYNKSSFDIFSEEQRTLKLLSQNPLFPKIAEEHTQRRLKVLETKPTIFLETYPFPYYIPPLQDFAHVDVIEIFKWRDLLGCIQGYKFYQEYFKPFTDLVRNYSKTEDKNRLLHEQAIKDLEIIGIIILHEPHLKQIVSDLLPDIYELLVRFIESVVIGDKEKRKKRNEIKVYDNSIRYKFDTQFLTYNWSKFSLVCLYTIIYKKEIFNSDNANAILLSLFHFCGEDRESMSYVIYFICNQVPILKEQVGSKPNRYIIEKKVDEFIAENRLNLPKELIHNLEKSLLYLLSRTEVETSNFKDVDKLLKIFGELKGFFLKDSIKGQKHNFLTHTFGQFYTTFDDEKDRNEVLTVSKSLKNQWIEIRNMRWFKKTAHFFA